MLYSQRESATGGIMPKWFMQTTRRKQLLYASLGFTFGQLLTGGKPLAAQDDCKLVLDAMIKVMDTPTHAYVTMDVSGKPQTAESIYVGGLIYAKYDGKWSAGTTTQEMKEIAGKNRQTNKTTCHYLKDEPVNGEMAAVYSVHDVSPRSTSVLETVQVQSDRVVPPDSQDRHDQDYAASRGVQSLTGVVAALSIRHSPGFGIAPTMPHAA